jgi:hypothetical protein
LERPARYRNKNGPSLGGQNAGAAIPMRQAAGVALKTNVGSRRPFLEAGMRDRSGRTGACRFVARRAA